MARTPKPTQLKVVGGNAGKRPLNKQEPDPDYLTDLTPPAHMLAEAAAVWRELAPGLSRAKVLTVLDVQALEFACNAIATYRAATARALQSPLAKSPETGAVSLNPWAIVQSMTLKQAMGILKEFGMTPAARSRVVVQPQGDLFGADGFGQFARHRPA